MIKVDNNIAIRKHEAIAMILKRFFLILFFSLSSFETTSKVDLPGQKFYPVQQWNRLKIKPDGLKPLQALASFPKFAGQYFKIADKYLEDLSQEEFPGFKFIEQGLKKINPMIRGCETLTLWPRTTITSWTINKMSYDSKLHVFPSKDLLKNCIKSCEPDDLALKMKDHNYKEYCFGHLPDWFKKMRPEINLSSLTSKDVTSCLVASVPTIVLVKPTDVEGVCELKKGCLNNQGQILVLGIAAINQGNSSEDQARHLQMLKNMFLVALDKGIEALTIVPPGCGAFGVDQVKMIELIAQALDSLKEHPNFRYFKVYLNAINADNQAIAEEKFKSLGLVDHLVLILGADILLYADQLAQQAQKAGRKGIVVATIDLLNPEALRGKAEWNFGWYPTWLSAQRTSAITSVELASNINNPEMYKWLIALPSLEDRCREAKKPKPCQWRPR